MSHVAHHVTPPPALPVGCISEIISIVRNGQTRERAACLYWCSMDCVAYAGGVIFGPPEGHKHESFGSLGDEQERIDECCVALAQAQLELQSFGAGEDTPAIDPATLLLIVQTIALAIELFKRLRR